MLKDYNKFLYYLHSCKKDIFKIFHNLYFLSILSKERDQNFNIINFKSNKKLNDTPGNHYIELIFINNDFFELRHNFDHFNNKLNISKSFYDINYLKYINKQIKEFI